MSDRPLVAVVVFPGSNDDRDAAWALGSVGAEPALVWHEETTLPTGTGGGRPARRLLVRRLPAHGRDRELRSGHGGRPRVRRDGGPVLGICNGFQILCEARLLPGVLRPNRQLEFVCRDAAVRVESDGQRCSCTAAASARSSSSPSSTARVPGMRTRARSCSSRRAARSSSGTQEDVNGALGTSQASSTSRERDGPHAAPGACRRPAARIGGRRARARGPRRRGGGAPRARTCLRPSPDGWRCCQGRDRRSQRLPEDGRALERRPQSLEIARPHRDGPSTGGPVGGVREAERRSPPAPGAAGRPPKSVCRRPVCDRGLLEELRRAPRRRGARSLRGRLSVVAARGRAYWRRGSRWATLVPNR